MGKNIIILFSDIEWNRRITCSGVGDFALRTFSYTFFVYTLKKNFLLWRARKLSERNFRF